MHTFVVRYSARAAWLFEIAFVVTRACLLERPGFKHYQGVASLLADLFITSITAETDWCLAGLLQSWGEYVVHDHAQHKLSDAKAPTKNMRFCLNQKVAGIRHHHRHPTVAMQVSFGVCRQNKPLTSPSNTLSPYATLV